MSKIRVIMWPKPSLENIQCATTVWETCLFFYNFQYLAIWIHFRVHFLSDKISDVCVLTFNILFFLELQNAIKLWFCTSSSVNRVICYNIKCDNLMISNPKNLVNRVTQFFLINLINTSGWLLLLVFTGVHLCFMNTGQVCQIAVFNYLFIFWTRIHFGAVQWCGG